MVTILCKNTNDSALAKTCITKRTGTATPELLLNIMDFTDSETEYFEVDQKHIYDGDEYYIRISGNSIDENQSPVQSVLNKIMVQSALLGDICNVNQGIVTGVNFLTEANKIKYSINTAETGEGIFLLSNYDLMGSYELEQDKSA